MVSIRFDTSVSQRSGSVALDAGQLAVVVLPDQVSVAVLGAPGSGKTTTLVELVAERVERRGWSPDELLVLAPSRASATRLRDSLAVRLDVPTNGPTVRTAPSLAFEITTSAARLAGESAPRLITGGEQDADIAAILEGHLDGGGSAPDWPEMLGPEVRRLRGFRTELRELMSRATEQGVDPVRLRELGRATGRPDWVAAADFFAEYGAIISSSRPNQFDSAELARFAEAAIRRGEAGDRVAAIRLVVVDDLQEATESTLTLLRAFAARGVPIVAFGDPDVAANAFRGGRPDAIGRLGAELGIDVETVTLPIVYRSGGELRALVSSVVGRIGTASAGTQRRAATAAAGSSVDPERPALARIEAATAARETTAIARVLREEHLIHGVPWSRLAVIVRGGGRVPSLARALALADVPTRSASGGIALREDGAARALLTLVDVGLGRTELTPEMAEQLLLGPFGGLDPLQLRRLRRALRAEEVAGGGLRPSGELLVEALGAPARLATVDSRAGRRALRVATTLDEVRRSEGSIEDLLWLAWDRSGLADSWRSQALGAGIGASEANRNLDGVVALFTAAKRFSERRPDVPAAEFLAEVLDAEVPEDTLSPRSSDDAVLVTTPSGAVGLEFTTVVVAAVQDGVWPNLRPRGTLLAPQTLADAASGRADLGVDAVVDDRRTVLDDELRMFALAVSRASERVVLSAVANDDESPSVLFSLLPPAPPLDGGSRMPLSLRATVGRLRRVLVGSGDPRTRAAVASTLSALADAGVTGADPSQWLGLIEPSTTAPLFEGVPVPVSPSRIERLEESPLDWFLETIAGSDPGVAANVGTILHWAMETAPDPSVEALWEAVESRWDELVFEAPWLAERQRRLAQTFTHALSEYLRDFSSAGSELVAAEGRFRLDLPGGDGVPDAVVSGSIDRVERASDGSVVIVDLKTGRPLTSQGRIDAHPQLGAYQLAYSSGVLDEALEPHGEHRPGGAKLLYVREGRDGRLYRQAEQRPLDEAQLEAVRARIAAAATVIASAEFEGLVELDDWGLGDVTRLRLNRVKAVSSD